jgi:hypothetical protein
MNTLIDQFLNGNLRDAKAQAKRFPAWEIRDALQDLAGYSLEKATLTADWLKGRECWQAACDAA